MKEEYILQIIVRVMIIIIIIIGLIVSIKYDYIGEKMFEFQQKYYTERFHKLMTLMLGILFTIFGIIMLLYKLGLFRMW